MATKSDFIVKSGLSVNTQITIGNSSVNATINSTAFSGTVSTANNASYLNGNSAATLIGLSNNAYNNAIAYAASNTYVNNTFAPKANPTFTGMLNAADVTVSGNLVVTGNVVSVNAVTLDVTDKNITVAKGSVSAAAADGAGLTVDGANATITYTSATDTWNFNKSIVVGNVTINGTSFSGTSNNSTYAFGKTEGNLNVNNALTSNNTSYLNGTAAASFVQNTDSRTLSGNLTFTGISTFSGNVTVSSALIANGGPGNAGQVLTSNGTALYWANAIGNTITLTNLTLNGTLTASGNNGSSGQYLTTDGSSVYWITPLTSSSVRQQFTANGTANSFSVTGGYSSNEIDVYVNGVKLYNGTEVIVSSGSTVDFVTPPANGALIEVVGALLSSGLTASFVQNTDSRVLSGNLQFTGANVFFSSGLKIGANVILNTSTLFVGNNSVNTYITANNIQLNGANVTTTDVVNTMITAALMRVYYANNTQAFP